MINNTARSLAQGQDVANQKIPSLFELNLSAPADKNDDKDDKGKQIGKHFFFTLLTILIFISYKLILR